MERPDTTTDAASPDAASLKGRARAREDLVRGIEGRIGALQALDPGKRLAELAFFGLLYGAGAAAVYGFQDVLPARIVGVLLMGLALNALPIFIHEGLHGLLARRPPLNHFLSFLVGLPILVSAAAYRTTHTDHHRQLGRKPDYGTYRQHATRTPLVWTAYLLQLVAGSLIYIASIPFLAFRAATPWVRVLIVAEYLVIALASALFLAIVPPRVVVLYWLFPLLVLNVLTNVRGLAAHALGDPEDLYVSSRTVTSPTWVSFLFLHENYHLEHHLFPGTPGYHLPEMHALLWPRLPRALASESYLHFLVGFFKAALRRDLGPMGVVTRGHRAPVQGQGEA